jgi:quinol monooxygenase YgiN
MLIVAGEIRMQSGTRDQFLEAVRPMVAASILEEGCRTYAFTPDPDDDDLIRLYELWDDEDAIAGHVASDHMAAWVEARAALPILSVDIMKYTVTEGVPLG